MASTYDQANAALRDYGTVFGRVAEEAFNMLQKFKDIDLASPTALEQINAIDAEYKSKAPGWNSDRESSRAILDSVYDNLPADGLFSSDKKNFLTKWHQAVAQYNNLVKQVNTLRKEMREAKANLEKAASEKTASTDTDKPAPEQPNPSTSDDAKNPTDTNKANSVKDPAIAAREAITATRNNPLSELSSSTYNITLYMVDATVMNKFISGGGTMEGIKGSDTGLKIIAQSGGNSTNDNVITDRAGKNLDYYIEDLDIVTFFPGGDQRATASTQIKFKIIEPYGFSFLHDLTRAGLELNKGKDKLAENMVGIKQHYIIGIKFKGYDDNGQVIQDTRIDSRYFAIRITKLKFKLDGKVVNYNCEAVIVSESIANGQINGTVKISTTLSGNTVYEALAGSKKDSLVSVLNSVGESNKDNNQVVKPTKYSIVFLDDGKISKQELINEKSFDEKLAATTGLTSSEQSSIAKQISATQYDNTKGQIHVTAGKHILSIIDSVIVKSNYVSSALNTIMSASTESKSSGQLAEKELEWYSVNPVVKIAGTDPKTNDWAYEVTYEISTFKIPYIRLTTADVTSHYQGPFKRYEYWLTGQNSEIISYEQQYDNLYYVSQIMARKAAEEQEIKGERPVHPSNGVNADKTGIEVKNFVYNAEAAAQLYSPGDAASAKIKIIGDPDYITSLVGVANRKEKDFQLSPLSGQKFIEIKFCMAEDYDSNGLMDVSGNIQFYGTATIKEKLKIDGAVYRIIKVDSMFSKGLFSQTLSLILVDQTVLTVKNTPSKSSSSSSSSSSPSSQQSSSNQKYGNDSVRAPVSYTPYNQNFGNEGRNNLTEITTGRIGLTTGAGANSRIPASMIVKAIAPAAATVVNNGTDSTQKPAPLDDAKLPKINPKTLLPIAGR
jgi:hypothetical protein